MGCGEDGGGGLTKEEGVNEHPWGPAGGTCLALRFCVCLLWERGGGFTALSPPPLPFPRDPPATPRDHPRDNNARGVPPAPGIPLTRSLHRQHPDSSVCLFVCFKYIYIIYYIYKHPYLFWGEDIASLPVSLLWNRGIKTFPVHRPEAELNPTGGTEAPRDAAGGGEEIGGSPPQICVIPMWFCSLGWAVKPPPMFKASSG